MFRCYLTLLRSNVYTTRTGHFDTRKWQDDPPPAFSNAQLLAGSAFCLGSRQHPPQIAHILDSRPKKRRMIEQTTSIPQKPLPLSLANPACMSVSKRAQTGQLFNCRAGGASCQIDPQRSDNITVAGPD